MVTSIEKLLETLQEEYAPIINLHLPHRASCSIVVHLDITLLVQSGSGCNKESGKKSYPYQYTYIQVYAGVQIK
jgi:hypothetical protein